MQQGVYDLLKKRMNKRTLAAILGAKERDLDPYLPDDVARQFRRVILEELNDFLDLVFEVIESLDDDSVLLNDYWLERLDAIYDHVVAQAVAEPVAADA